MTVKTAPRKLPESRPPGKKTIPHPAEGSPQENTSASQRLPANGGAAAEIRIYRDGLLIAKCFATGIAPSRLFIAIDPLYYPVNSRLEIEFIRCTGMTAKSVRLPATVMNRSAKGIELRLDPAVS
ncbi:MAG: hypothetical protein WBP44_14210 [Gammaproteobacteria bacterium]|jgi:hypothetical protein